MGSSSVSAAFWTMIALQTMGSVDMPGKGERKMPSPRAYLATIVMFSVLHVIADSVSERAAATMAWVTVLVGLIKGPFGGQLTNLINAVAPAQQPLQSTPPDTSGGST